MRKNIIISIVAAMNSDEIIGYKGKLPWDWKEMPADMKRFKKLTMDKPVIMGRKTLESIGGPLPGRWNIVLSCRNDFNVPGTILAKSPEDAIRIAESCGDATEAMVIGGEEVFNQFLPIADRIYLTVVYILCSGDTFFPFLSRNDWKEKRRVHILTDKDNRHPMIFFDLERWIPR